MLLLFIAHRPDSPVADVLLRRHVLAGATAACRCAARTCTEQNIATRRTTSQHGATCCNTAQHVESTARHIVHSAPTAPPHCSTARRMHRRAVGRLHRAYTICHVATLCRHDTLQRNAARHVAAHCELLQPSAAPCNSTQPLASPSRCSRCNAVPRVATARLGAAAAPRVAGAPAACLACAARCCYEPEGACSRPVAVRSAHARVRRALIG